MVSFELTKSNLNSYFDNQIAKYADHQPVSLDFFGMVGKYLLHMHLNSLNKSAIAAECIDLDLKYLTRIILIMNFKNHYSNFQLF